MTKTLPVILSLSLLAGGCAYHGPEALRMTRPEYNVVIQQTNDQELLLNLVRLKYRDTPYFLGVEKVASSLEFSRGLSASATLPESADDSFGLAGAITFAEKPTLFYAPLEGERFVRQLMTPLPLDTLVLLANSGWSVERVFAITLQAMNDIKNAPTAAGPTPARAPEYQDFRAALRHLRALQTRKAVELGRAASGDGLELRFAPGTASDPDAQAFKRLLALHPDRHAFRLEAGLGGGGGDRVSITPRSLIAAMNYLSQGVEAPAADQAAGRVTRTLDGAGADFDWQRLLSGVFRVHSSSERRADATVAVRYRGRWFQILDHDLDSKSTFALLAQLLALQGGLTPGQASSISYSIGQ